MVRKKIPKRRRREGKTDYKLRMGLLKSGLPRIVVRKSNKYFTIQIVESKNAQDKTKLSLTSRSLVKDSSLNNSGKSIPVCYLLGLAFGKKVAQDKELSKKEFILDFGLYRILKGGRLFAVAKGLKDSGINIRVGEEMFPSDDRIQGKHLPEEKQKEISKLKKQIENG